MRTRTPSASCNARLDQFFPEWWDTAFPTGGANTTNKPKLSGPGLNGTGFVCAQVTPATPDGKNGWYTGNVSIDWQGYVYDCDFNQMLDLPLQIENTSRPRIADLIGRDLAGNPIAVRDHCYGCTAGQGSSCGGALSG